MMSEILRQLLEKRGIPAEEQAVFLNPDFERDTHDGSLMKDMDLAIARIKKAIENKEVITVFGDYDADGVPATALLVRAFKRVGVNVNPIIPLRADGYGLTEPALKRIRETNATLLITLDNGTVSKQEIAALASEGIDTIVCDHHEPQEGHIADAALAILNPKQPGCPYPFKELCGCAIGWKLMVELYKEMGKSPDSLKWDLDLVALSTVADMVPLLGENRVLVSFGLKVMRKSRNIGLGMLASVAGIRLEAVGAGSIGFQLAPRINAPSRMHEELRGDRHASLQLLITKDQTEALDLATYLNAKNIERQTLLDRHLEEATAKVVAQEENLCMVAFDPSWSTGVIGLVAGRLLEQYKRPVIVLAPEDGVIKGSVRSVDGADTLSLLTAAEEVLERYGGHAKAGGLTMKKGETPERLCELVNLWMQKEGFSLESMKASCLRSPDLDVTLPDVDVNLAKELRLLEPFGMGFPTPLFHGEYSVANIRKVGSEKQHLSCVLEGDGASKKAIAFRYKGLDLEPNHPYSAYYTISLDEWNGQEQISCHIQRIEEL